MRIILTALILIALISAAAVALVGDEKVGQQSTSLAISTENLLVYRNAGCFADARPNVRRTLQDRDLNLPAWFRPINGLSARVDNGVSYVWFIPTGDLQGLADRLLSEAGSTALAGYKRNGRLFSPRDGSTAISFPSMIPDGALVYFNPAKAAAASSSGGSSSSGGGCGARPADVTQSQPGPCPVGSTGPGWTQARSAGWSNAG